MDFDTVKGLGITCIKVASWATVAALCARGAWKIGNHMEPNTKTLVKPFKNIKSHKLSDFLPK